MPAVGYSNPRVLAGTTAAAGVKGSIADLSQVYDRVYDFKPKL